MSSKKNSIKKKTSVSQFRMENNTETFHVIGLPMESQELRQLYRSLHFRSMKCELENINNFLFRKVE